MAKRSGEPEETEEAWAKVEEAGRAYRKRPTAKGRDAYTAAIERHFRVHAGLPEPAETGLPPAD